MAAGQIGNGDSRVAKASTSIIAGGAKQGEKEDTVTGQHSHSHPVVFRTLYKPPVTRQWIEGDVLFKETSERAVSRYELAFDLAFSGIIHIMAEAAAVDRTGLGVRCATV